MLFQGGWTGKAPVTKGSQSRNLINMSNAARNANAEAGTKLGFSGNSEQDSVHRTESIKGRRVEGELGEVIIIKMTKPSIIRILDFFVLSMMREAFGELLQDN